MDYHQKLLSVFDLVTREFHQLMRSKFVLKYISDQKSKIMLAIKNSDTSLYVRLPMISFKTEQGDMQYPETRLQ